ncbi:MULTISPECIES: hypothetical protein [unclassified Actinoplanes]|uniref:hypothetical protein n=1 Tax=unclassified Actinoplanes TaxID=2626549 RepID=UPI0012BAD785|nr:MULTISPECIES: hypothetical protein [unclassified Actinoplanes]
MNAEAPGWLVELLRRHTVFDEMLMSAWLDKDPPERAVIFGKDAHLGGPAGWLSMVLADGDYSLRLSGPDRPRLHEELNEDEFDAADDEDTRPLFVSVAGTVMSTYFPVRCRSVTLFLSAESELENGVARAVLFDLSTGPLFIDPFHLDGIRLAGAAEADALRTGDPGITVLEIPVG